ncbi:MAG TPA: AI-2E family transporter [Terriglobia bacterium]|nr:AI-2E family transporter [Terriglobia bacterium]
MEYAQVKDSQEIATDRTLKRISASLSLIVLSLAIALCYAAKMLCITVIVASFLAILVDPLVARLQKMHIRLHLAAAIVVICGGMLFGAAAYVAYQNANNFANQLPVYSSRLRQALEPIITKVQSLQRNAESIAPAPADGVPEVKVHQGLSLPSFLIRGMDSITSSLILAAVIPFLCFFMLVKKEQFCARFRIMFDGRIDVPKFTRNLDGVVRGFVVGNLVVGLIMAGTTTLVLFILGIKNPIMLGIFLSLLNLIPFLGAIAAGVVATAAGLLQFTSLWPFLVLMLTILVLHVITQNVLIPRIIGPRVSVGPVAVIIGMLFWGWLWGVWGLLLAVPLTAFLKLIADTQPSLVHLSDLLGASPCQRTVVIRVKESSITKAGAAYRNPGAETAVKS